MGHPVRYLFHLSVDINMATIERIAISFWNVLATQLLTVYHLSVSLCVLHLHHLGPVDHLALSVRKVLLQIEQLKSSYTLYKHSSNLAIE